MIFFFSGTGKPPTVEPYQKGIDVMMTFYDPYVRGTPLPKMTALEKVRKKRAALGKPVVFPPTTKKKKKRK